MNQERFLQAFSECGNITAAARGVGLARTAHYEWMKTDPGYPARFEQAQQQAIEALEAEAHRRAVKGVDRPVYQGGRMVGTVREFSDVLLIFLLKGANPQKYRDNAKVEHAGTLGLEHHGGVNLTAVRQELLRDSDYLEYLRMKAMAAEPETLLTSND